MASARIAVIAVHGVADQRPGDTARALVELMVASAPDGTSYQALDSESITLAVDPLATPRQHAAAADATPLGEQRTATKQLLQSARSDFQREGWTAAESPPAWRARRGAPVAADADQGIAYSSYLLGKNLRNGAVRESYQTTRLGLQRRAGGDVSRVDVYEMYWADLSRLSGALPRIITELFTMIFRLSKLGRETVDFARAAMQAGPATSPGLQGRVRRIGWSGAAWLQIILDWLFANGLALLFLQLALLATLLLGVGLLAMLDPLLLSHVDRVAAALVAIAGLLVIAYRYRERNWRTLLLPLLATGIGLIGLLWLPALAPWIGFALLIGLVTAVSETGLRVADDRFPAVRRIGRVMWAAVLLVVVVGAVRQALAARGLDIAGVARAAIVGAEFTLFFVKWTWIVIGSLMPAWLVAGWMAGWRADYQAKASIATGRLGLGLSLGAFLAVTMTVWALLSGAIEAAVQKVDYVPCIFVPAARPEAAPAGASGAGVAAKPPPAAAGPSAASGVAAAACPLPAAARPTLQAGTFLQQRFVASTGGFALVALVLLGMIVFLLAMFVPSVLAELKLLVRRARKSVRDQREPGRARRSGARLAAAFAADDVRARRLGRWLTMGYRSLDGVAHAVLGAGIAFGLLVALAFAGVTWLRGLDEVAGSLSQGLLKGLVIGAASVAASLVIFGGLLSRYLPGIRGPLDIALDVDNHFREFPRNSIPRARIFSRYVALLREVTAGGYDHIVVVAHSQGSVISAELLRYLSSDGSRPPQPGARPRIDGSPLPPIRLLTVGCPLRQLYAARFPTLYRWVLARRSGVSGPRAADIGVERWFNAFCSGDYVGRWLWSEEPDADQDPLAHPMVESVGSAFGRSDAYSGFDPMPPDDAAFAQATEAELCLGLGAHTHYFEPEQTTVAWLVDRLVGGEWEAGVGEKPGEPPLFVAAEHRGHAQRG